MQELRIAAAVSRDREMLNTFFTERDNPTINDEEGEFPNPLVDLHVNAALSIFPHLNNVSLRKLMKASKEISPTGESYRNIAKIFNFCVPLHSLALVKGRGWVKPDDLIIGSYIETYDLDIGSYTWTKVIDIHRGRDLLCSISYRDSFYIEATSNHRWVCIDGKGDLGMFTTLGLPKDGTLLTTPTSGYPINELKIDFIEGVHDVWCPTTEKGTWITKQHNVISLTGNSVIYGAAAQSLAPSLGCSPEEAQEYLNKYFSRFNGLKKWLDTTAKVGKKQKWVRNAIGRLIFVNESNNKGSDNAVERKACNALVQSVGAEMMRLALYKVDKALDKLNTNRRLINPSAKEGWIQAPIHDELVCVVPEPPKLVDLNINEKGISNPIYEFEDVSWEYAEAVRQGMESAMSDILSPIIGEPFPSKSDAGLGWSWAAK